jgi:hypothetical protein
VVRDVVSTHSDAGRLMTEGLLGQHVGIKALRIWLSSISWRNKGIIYPSLAMVKLLCPVVEE